MVHHFLRHVNHVLYFESDLVVYHAAVSLPPCAEIKKTLITACAAIKVYKLYNHLLSICCTMNVKE